ncbi:alpha/beta hydrolase [Bacteroidota bacterium]
MRRYAIILVFLSIAAVLHGMQYCTDTINVDSEILNETRSILIFHPERMKANVACDLLYMLDGEWAESRFALLEEGQETNPLIAIGIINTNRNRDMLPLKEAERFMDFIELELIPLLEEKFMVKNRILYGHSFAGGFTINVMLKKPGLFDKYIASSPTPIMTFIDPQVYIDLDHHLNKEVKLYFSYGSRDMRQVKKWAAKLHSSLHILEFEHLKWENEILEGMNHNTSVPTAFKMGLDF